MAHLPGCFHKGDDPDFSGWGEIRDVPRAWERIGNGDVIAANAGANVELRADRRCKDCDDRARQP